MNLIKPSLVICCFFFILGASSCSKDKESALSIRKIVYVVTGTHFRLNYIDSNSVFQKDQIFSGSFRYEFRREPGTAIGISIFKVAPDDLIYSWEIYIDDKLHADAFSEGGAYFTIPQF
jgi:hypothetical protein